MRGNKYDIRIKNIYYKYNNKDKFILENINLSFDKNQMYAILGASGSGKTTLLSLLAGLDLLLKERFFIQERRLISIR